MSSRLLKLFLGLLIIAVPLLMFANVWFSHQYFALENRVEALKEVQQETIERNKRLITGISILRSPGRIITQARKLGMEMSGKDQLTVIDEDL